MKNLIKKQTNKQSTYRWGFHSLGTGVFGAVFFVSTMAGIRILKGRRLIRICRTYFGGYLDPGKRNDNVCGGYYSMYKS